MIDKLFVPTNLALMAKEKSFNEKCLGYRYPDGEVILLECTPFSNERDSGVCTSKNGSKIFTYGVTAAPLYSQLINWFIEEHKLYIRVSSLMDHPVCGTNTFDFDVTNLENASFIESDEFESYHEALNKAILEAFKLI